MDHEKPDAWVRGQNAIRFFLHMSYRDFYGELVQVPEEEGQATEYEPGST